MLPFSMMLNIIFNPHSLHNFTDYGIAIPLLNERVLNAISELKPIIDIKPSSIKPALIDDLNVAYSEEFISKIKSNPEKLVLETYELIDSSGNYRRYDPKLAKKPLTDFIEKALLHLNGTYKSSLLALNSGFSYHFGGGMHHAMSMKPGGFCMFNDIVYSIKKLQNEKFIKDAIVIDLDCHKGDGTAQMTCEDKTIRTFSIHMKNGWPLDSKDKNSPSFIPSNCDVPVSPEDSYLSVLKKELSNFIKKDDQFAIIVHGVDVYENDALESSQGIKLTSEEVLERDMFVYNLLKENKIDQSWVIGGGYGKVSHLYTQFIKAIITQQQK